ncbi:hypothetical protein CCP2SC5_320018 [Azospirillaceae bacterium]
MNKQLAMRIAYAVELAQEQNNQTVVKLLKEALEKAMTALDLMENYVLEREDAAASWMEGSGGQMSERRLGDRILVAFEQGLAVRQLEVCGLLKKSLEIALTRFGGPGALEKRNDPARVLAAFNEWEALKRPSP